MKKYQLYILIFFCLPVLAQAQGPGSAAVPFVLISPSPMVGGSVGGNVVLPTDDIQIGFYLFKKPCGSDLNIQALFTALAKISNP